MLCAKCNHRNGCVHTNITLSDVLDKYGSDKNEIKSIFGFLFRRSRGIVFIDTNDKPPYAMG